MLPRRRFVFYHCPVMPIYEYQASDPQKGCRRCAEPFEQLQKINDPPIEQCPHCRQPLRRLISTPSVGASKSGLDDRAKGAGFHKLKRLGKGEYEKQY